MTTARAGMHELVSDADFSSWGMRDVAYPFVPGEGKFPDYGCFPVGNGMIFGHLGVDADFSLLRGLTGPGYQTRGDEGEWQVWQEGNWPDIPLSFKATAPKGPHEPVFHLGDKWTSQSIEQVRGGAIVRVNQSAEFGELSIIQYAVPDMPVLIREYRFVPVAGRADPDWNFFLQVGTKAAEVESDGLVFKQGDNRLTIQCRGFREIPELPQCVAGELQADGSWVCNLACIVSKAGEPRAAVELDEAGVMDLATRTLSWWREFSANCVQPDVFSLFPDTIKTYLIQTTLSPKQEDMLIQLPVIIETQRDYYSGSSSPMVSYHGCWVRDNNGIILTDIVNKRFDNVMRLLRYHRAACVQYGSVPMLVPLDLDLHELPGWQPGEPGTAGDLSGVGATGFDWSGFGVERAEVPSLIVIQHYLLWRAMHETGQGDAADAFIHEAWGFITHNLTAMAYSAEYGVLFHGDETYTQGALYSTYDRPESGQLGWPNGYIPTEFYSFDNTILHRAAAAAIMEMAGSAGWDGGLIQANKVMDELDEVIRDRYIVDGRIAVAISPVTSQPWLPPFSNISLRPYWLGLDYGKWPDGLLADNFARISSVLSDGRFMQSTPWSGYMTGHNLGYWLEAAGDSNDNELGTRISHMLLDSASPEGAWCEVLGPDGIPVEIYGRTNRIRPWESGVNYAAIINDFWRSDRRFANEKLHGREPEKQTDIRPEPPVATAPHSTELLAITLDNHFREVMDQDHRLAKVDPAKITAWDIALPFSPDELYRALMFEEGDIDYNIPFLYIDRDVRGGLDRRSMKDEHFWAEIDKVLADYEAAGGIVLTEDTLRPAWEAQLERDPAGNSFKLDIEGPDGKYEGKLQTAHQPSLIEQRLQQDGLLPSIAYAVNGKMDGSGNAVLSLPAEQFALLQNESMQLDVTYTDETGNEISYTHKFPGTQRLKDRLNAIDTEALPDYAIRAVRIENRQGAPLSVDRIPELTAILLDPQSGNVFSGTIDSEQDASLSCALLYDDDYLYVLAYLQDDMRPGSGIWDSDRINLCFDAQLDSDDTDYPKGAVGHAGWQRDDYWMLGCPFSSSAEQVMRLGGETPGDTTTGYNGPVSGSKITVQALTEAYSDRHGLGVLPVLLADPQQTANTFWISWSIPLSELPYLDASPGNFCGLTIFYSDMDESLSEMMYFNDWGDGRGGIEWRLWDTGLLYFEAP